MVVPRMKNKGWLVFHIGDTAVSCDHKEFNNMREIKFKFTISMEILVLTVNAIAPVLDATV